MNVTFYVRTEIERKMRVTSMWLLCLGEKSMGLDRSLVSPVKYRQIENAQGIQLGLV